MYVCVYVKQVLSDCAHDAIYVVLYLALWILPCHLVM